MSLYCILTNLVCVFPAQILWVKQRYGDAIFTLSTGLASLVYHSDEIYESPLNTVAIRNVDIIMADLIMCHTCHMFFHFQRRWDWTISVLPIQIYAAELDVLYRFAFMILWGIVAISMALTHQDKYHMKYLVFGTLCILSELLFFMFANKIHYYWLHGTHHITAFVAQGLFLKSIKSL